MELGALELQIFVSLIVILGTAFVALVCDYLKGSNESLREHNIELRVRREEQERNRPLEAVEWLQHMLGATRSNPVRFGSNRGPRVVPGRNRSTQPAEAPAAAPAPAAARPAAKPAAAAAVPTEARPMRPAAAARVAPEQAPVIPPMAAPVQKPEFAAVALAEAVAAAAPVASEEKSIRSLSGRMRRAGTDRPPVSLLDTLPVPAWVKKEQEEIAAARVKVSAEPAPAPVVETVLEEPVVAAIVSVPAASLAEPVSAEPLTPVTIETQRPVPVLAFEKPFLVEAVAESRLEPVPETVLEASPATPVTTFTPEPVHYIAESYQREPLPFFQPQPEPVTEVAASEEIQPVFASTAFMLVREEVPQEASREVSQGSLIEERPLSVLLSEPEPEPMASPAAGGFWSYRGLMDREPEKTEATPAPTQEQEREEEKITFYSPVLETAPETIVPAEPVAEVAVEVPVLVSEEPKREELTRENFILYRNSEPVRQVEPEPEFVDIESRAETFTLPVAPVIEAPIVVAGPAIPELELPAGYQDRAVLQQLMTSTSVLTGVVVAIGINDYAHQVEKMGASAMQDLMRNVEQMVAGLLRPGIDFGCRSSEDEFILVFNKEAGPEAQRRLSTISERLWNFQLRSLTSFSVFFSWGAVEVQSETLADAAASASERMYQTKRNRKTVTMDQRRKKAVNL